MILGEKRKVRGNVAAPCLWCGHYGHGFKLIMQKFIYMITPKKNRRGFEVEFDAIWYTIQVGKEKLNLIVNPKYES